MNRQLPIIAALGAGLALWSGWTLRKRRVLARQWAQQESRRRSGTAFITGASSGIGAEFARSLARMGYSLVLVARRADRLRALAEALESEYGVPVETLAADLSDPSRLEMAAAHLAAIPDLSLLVNNAGFGTGGRFAAIPVEPELKMIRLHVDASVRLTHAALPGMIARGHGGIINVSSFAALMPLPGTATYGSTKAYLNFFGKALQVELAGSGVRVQALCPGFTYSEFHDVAGMSRRSVPSFLWMQSGDVVRESLEGLHSGQLIVIPGKVYRLLALILRFPPVAPLAHLVQEMRLARMKREAGQPPRLA